MAMLRDRLKLHNLLGIGKKKAAGGDLTTLEGMQSYGSNKLSELLGVKGDLRADSQAAYQNMVKDITKSSSFYLAVVKDYQDVNLTPPDDEATAYIAGVLENTNLRGAFDCTLIGRHTYNLLKQANDKLFTERGKIVVEHVQRLIDESPISHSEAMKAVNGVSVSDEVTQQIQRQRKGDYRGKFAMQSLKLELANIYRLTNGLALPDMLVKTDPRACHYNEYTKGKSAINVGSGLTKQVLWHEVAHRLEYVSQDVLDASKSFLSERLKQAEAEGKGIRRLKDLYPRSKYKRNEITIDDSAFSAYVTKLYTKDSNLPIGPNNIRSSEVVSMGIECLASPSAAGAALATDPDHIAYMLGLIKRLQSSNK
ncbi:flagellar hook-length control protein FliK [Photobacterium aphoticum]|uniref:Flagellar hook-length control protein FliK n=1 Tax=Photobacterium aphoticum TaxID=754436 RepID=A0A090R1K4_9GAMM|nr:flagellar hook-length control protein FliK [Photobacterium aphoticum]